MSRIVPSPPRRTVHRPPHFRAHESADEYKVRDRIPLHARAACAPRQPPLRSSRRPCLGAGGGEFLDVRTLPFSEKGMIGVRPRRHHRVNSLRCARGRAAELEVRAATQPPRVDTCSAFAPRACADGRRSPNGHHSDSWWRPQKDVERQVLDAREILLPPAFVFTLRFPGCRETVSGSCVEFRGGSRGSRPLTPRLSMSARRGWRCRPRAHGGEARAFASERRPRPIASGCEDVEKGRGVEVEAAQRLQGASQRVGLVPPLISGFARVALYSQVAPGLSHEPHRVRSTLRRRL